MTTAMLKSSQTRKFHHEEPESPYVNFTDALTGVVLIFLMLVLVLALNQSRTAEDAARELDELGRQVALMLAQRDLLNEEIVELEGQHSQAVIAINEINTQRDAVAKNLAVLQLNLGEGNSRLAAVTREAEAAGETLAAIEQDITHATETRIDLEGNLVKLQDQVAAADAASTMAEADYQAISIQVGQLTAEKVAREAEVDGIRIAIERGKSKMNELQAQIAGLQIALSDLERKSGAADEGRTILLDTIEAKLEEGGITGVTVDRSNDSLVLQEEILFDTGSYGIKSPRAIRTVIQTLVEILPCSTAGMSLPPDCNAKVGKLSGVLIEGHADRQGDATDNMVLSSQRALAVYDEIMRSPQLRVARPYGRDVGAGLFGIAGYGETRPAVATADGVKNALNRRIAIRLLYMAGR